MVAARNPGPIPNLPPRILTYRLGPRRILNRGDEAMIYVAGRKSRLRVTFRYADERGNLTFVDSRNGGLRTVPASAVAEICRKTKLRGNP